MPQHAFYDWEGVAGTIILRGRKGRHLILDLDYRDLPEGEVALRLAVETDGIDYEPEELPKITPMSAVEAK